MTDIDRTFETLSENKIIRNTAEKLDYKLNYYMSPVVSVSGGSDSDIMVDLVERVRGDRKVTYAWYDTGIEYEATKRHLDELEAKYSIKIERVKAVVPVPVGCKRYGLPFISKTVSVFIGRLQKHGFKWEDEPYETLMKRYPNCKAALRWWCNNWGDKSSFNISNNKDLKEFMVKHPPDFEISAECCTGAKKKTGASIERKYNAHMSVIGVRRAENGQRSARYKNCFSFSPKTNMAYYRPLYFWSDEDKREYKEWAGIRYSDCYEIWGMVATGCAGCPFGSRFEQELQLIHQYEPKLERAVVNIFGKSYEYMRAYREFKKNKRANASA